MPDNNDAFSFCLIRCEVQAEGSCILSVAESLEDVLYLLLLVHDAARPPTPCYMHIRLRSMAAVSTSKKRAAARGTAWELIRSTTRLPGSVSMILANAH